MSKIALLVDFGSTFSKFTAVNLDQATVIDQLTLPTNSKGNLINCYLKGKEEILKSTSIADNQIEEYFCSSAWGGFRMIAIGLTESLTSEAAQRAALGAGTRILDTYCYKLSIEQVLKIKKDNPDVILLTGGTDGGNQDIICYNANLLSQYLQDGVVLYAGNQEAIPKIKEIFSQSPLKIYYTENVMPTVNVLNANPVRTIARNIFMKKIIQTEGISDVAKFSNVPIIPTPTAVLKAAELLADGTKEHSGIGPLAIIDIGGATTDIHSVGDGLPKGDNIFFEGLEEPYLKRTVEGDLGMRSSAGSLVKNTGLSEFQNMLGNVDWSIEHIKQACKIRINQPNYIAQTDREKFFDDNLAFIAANTAMTRHVGKFRLHHTPTRTVYYQTGKDLRDFQTVIGTGGVIVHNRDPKVILKKACQNTENVLKPTNPLCLIDNNYLISTLGTLAQSYPDIALKLLKKNLNISELITN